MLAVSMQKGERKCFWRCFEFHDWDIFVIHLLTNIPKKSHIFEFHAMSMPKIMNEKEFQVLFKNSRETLLVYANSNDSLQNLLLERAKAMKILSNEGAVRFKNELMSPVNCLITMSELEEMLNLNNEPNLIPEFTIQPKITILVTLATASKACSICLSEIQSEKKTLICSHFFHREYINKCFKKSFMYFL